MDVDPDLSASTRRLWVPVLGWVMAAYVHSMVRLQALAHWIPGDGPAVRWWPGWPDREGRIGWGSGDYERIALDGYGIRDGSEAVFPGYALLLRYLSELGDWNVPDLQVALSLASGLAATVLAWIWMGQRGASDRARLVALLLFLTYPFSFMIFGIAYNDPFLLPLMIGAMILVERDRPVLAGLVGAAATITRPNALPIIAFLVVWVVAERKVIDPAGARWWQASRWRWHVNRLRPRDLGVLLSIAGVAAYSAWLANHSSDPLFFLKAQQYYAHEPITRWTTWLKPGIIDAHDRTFGTEAWTRANHGVTLAFIVGAVALLPAVVRRLGVAYGVLAGGLLVMSWSGAIGFAPAGRWLLPALPLYVLVLGEWGTGGGRRRLLAVGALALAFATWSFTLTIFFARPSFWMEW